MMFSPIYCTMALMAVSTSLADQASSARAAELGYGVECSDNTDGYGCEHHRQRTYPVQTTTEMSETSHSSWSLNYESSTKPAVPVQSIVSGVVASGVAAAGVGLIAAAVHEEAMQETTDVFTTTMQSAGSYATTVQTAAFTAGLPPAVSGATTVPAALGATPAPAFLSRLVELPPTAAKDRLNGKRFKVIGNNGAFGLHIAAAVVSISLFVCGVVGMISAFSRARRAPKAAPMMLQTIPEYDQVSRDVL
jgi:hypothetical protein